MYNTPGMGGVTAAVAGVATGGVVGAILPVTGSSTVIEISVALAAGLAAWAVVYVAVRKHGAK